MKKVLIILLLFAPLISLAQNDIITMIIHGDTLYLKNWTTNDSIKLNRTVPSQVGQAGKLLSATGTENGYEWVTASATDATKLAILNNLSDLNNASTARTNLSLGNVDNTSDANKPVSSAQATAISARGYTLSVQALTSSPADAGTIYFGQLPKAPVTAAATSKIYIRKAGTIKSANIYCYSGTAGTSEAWVLHIRLNNSTDTQIASVAAATNERVFSNTGLNIAVSVGDYVEIKAVNPTWATNPLTTIWGGYIYIE